MKKKLVAMIMALVCAIGAFAGCGPDLPNLESPEVRVNDNIVMWKKVENAKGYVVTVNGEEYTVEDLFFDLSFLDNGVECDIEVRAVGDGENFLDSEISPIHCTIKGKPAEKATEALVYNMLPDRSGYEVTRKNQDHKGLEGRVVIPDTYNNLPVKRIADNAFKTTLEFDLFEGKIYPKNEVTTSVRLPAYLEEIGESAFEECLALERVEFPKSLRRIGNTAFSKCRKLKTLVLPKGVEEIGSNAFRLCALESIKLPESVKVIGEGAFLECEDLAEIQLPTTLEYMGEGVFNSTAWFKAHKDEDFMMLGNVFYKYRGNMKGDFTSSMLPEGTKYIAGGAFQSQKMQSVTLTDEVEVIGNRVFSNCVNLRSASIAKMKNVYDNTFLNCRTLEEVTLPNGVEEIYSNAFAMCYALQNIQIPSTVKRIGRYAFSECKALEEISLPEGLETLGIGAFSNCPSLRKVTLPSTLKKLDELVFTQSLQLTEIILPAGVEEIANMLSRHEMTIYYKGNAEAFANVKVVGPWPNSQLEKAVVYYYAETNPGTGNYWHYGTDNQTPVKW